MSVSQRVTQNQYFIYLRKGKEETDMELLEEILNQNNLNWKQWKKIRKKCESLQKLGVPFEIAFNCANTRKGYYQICKTRYIQFAINNERLRKRGLVFLLDQYEKVHI